MQIMTDMHNEEEKLVLSQMLLARRELDRFTSKTYPVFAREHGFYGDKKVKNTFGSWTAGVEALDAYETGGGEPYDINTGPSGETSGEMSVEPADINTAPSAETPVEPADAATETAVREKSIIDEHMELFNDHCEEQRVQTTRAEYRRWISRNPQEALDIVMFYYPLWREAVRVDA